MRYRRSISLLLGRITCRYSVEGPIIDTWVCSNRVKLLPLLLVGRFRDWRDLEVHSAGTDYHFLERQLSQFEPTCILPSNVGHQFWWYRINQLCAVKLPVDTVAAVTQPCWPGTSLTVGLKGNYKCRIGFQRCCLCLCLCLVELLLRFVGLDISKTTLSFSVFFTTIPIAELM